MFEHKNVKIEVAENGEFSATINGVFKKKASLSAIKKAIDAANEFVPFKALVNKRYSSDLVEVEIVGIKKARSKTSWRNPDEWLDKAGGTHRFIIRDTPENRALIAAEKSLYAERAAALKAVETKYDDACEAAREAIPYESVAV